MDKFVGVVNGPTSIIYEDDFKAADAFMI